VSASWIARVVELVGKGVREAWPADGHRGIVKDHVSEARRLENVSVVAWRTEYAMTGLHEMLAWFMQEPQPQKAEAGHLPRLISIVELLGPFEPVALISPSFRVVLGFRKS
jgi:hypothetical protein